MFGDCVPGDVVVVEVEGDGEVWVAEADRDCRSVVSEGDEGRAVAVVDVVEMGVDEFGVARVVAPTGEVMVISGSVSSWWVSGWR